MQTPVRFYITQSDDQAVVHTVPVAIRHPVPTVDSSPRTNVETTNATATDTAVTNDLPRRAKLTKIVRAATHRSASRQ